MLPHNGKIFNVDHFKYYGHKSQTAPRSNISSMTYNKVVLSLTIVSHRVYKDATFHGYSWPPTPSKPSSSSVYMLQASRSTHKWSSMSLQHTTPSQIGVPSSTQPSSTTLQVSFHSAELSPNSFPPGTIPPTLNHLGLAPPGHYPFHQIPFLFLSSSLFYTCYGYVEFIKYYLRDPSLVHPSSRKHST